MNSKQKKYKRLADQLSEILKDSPDMLAQMATINAILYHKMPFFWVGFYFVSDNELTIGPYQGPVACQRLKKPNGVCWASVIVEKPVIVPNVEEFPNHIACDSRAKSEIAIPIKGSSGKVMAVLDVDSRNLDQFDKDDKEGLSNILRLIHH
jgi:GAF domain-containing protein